MPTIAKFIKGDGDFLGAGRSFSHQIRIEINMQHECELTYK